MAVRDAVDIKEKARADQWEQLIIAPLNSTWRGEKIVRRVVIIDGLDRCDEEADIKGVLEVLPMIHSVVGIELRIIIFSRPEKFVREGFAGIQGLPEFAEHHEFVRQVSLDDHSRQGVEQDIRAYISNKSGNAYGGNRTLTTTTGLVKTVPSSSPVFLEASSSTLPRPATSYPLTRTRMQRTH
jgi:hypothetical protein